MAKSKIKKPNTRSAMAKKEEIVETESEPEPEIGKSESDDNVEENKSGDSSDDDSESGNENDDVDALFKGSGAQDDEGDDDEDSDADEESENIPTLAANKATDECTFDLRNMTAMNTHQIPTSSLHSKKAPKDQILTIALEGQDLQVDESFLLKEASASCKQLIAAIWQLPTESSDAGPLASLPTYEEVRIPRSMVSENDIQKY